MNKDIRIIDSDLEARFGEIRRRIRRLQSGGTLDSLQHIGASIDGQIGASFVSLRQLARRYLPDEALALLLWNVRRREEQIMACLLLPAEVKKEKIARLEETCGSYEIAGYLGSLYLCRRPDLDEIAGSWIESGRPFLQTAVLTALARYLILHKKDGKIGRAFFQAVLNRPYADPYVRLIAERYRFNVS